MRLIRDRAAFVILDNLEQISDADVVVAELLSGAPQVRCWPPPGDPAFRLTRDNAADVVALCRRLDGLPLAIELVAARSRMLSPRAMSARIEGQPEDRTAVRDRAHRQRSLTATVAWSYDLLDEEDQSVYQRLGVFAGGVDLNAISFAVGSQAGDTLDAVAHLVDVSLLDAGEGPDGEPVISMLETIRHFARDRLETSGESDEIRLRHAQCCLRVASGISQLLQGPNQMRALDRMEAA